MKRLLGLFRKKKSELSMFQYDEKNTDTMNAMIRLLEYHQTNMQERRGLVFKLFIALVTLYLVVYLGYMQFLRTELHIILRIGCIYCFIVLFTMTIYIYRKILLATQKASQYSRTHYKNYHDLLKKLVTHSFDGFEDTNDTKRIIEQLRSENLEDTESVEETNAIDWSNWTFNFLVVIAIVLTCGLIVSDFFMPVLAVSSQFCNGIIHIVIIQ